MIFQNTSEPAHNVETNALNNAPHANHDNSSVDHHTQHGLKTLNNNQFFSPDIERPARFDMLMDMPPCAETLALKHAWNPEDRSLNIFVKEDDVFTFHRHPVAQSTDCIRGSRGYSRGLHVWELRWPVRQRGTHAVVGVATGDAPLHCVGYQSLVGFGSDSWGWDLGRGRLMHNAKNCPTRPYPVLGVNGASAAKPLIATAAQPRSAASAAVATNTNNNSPSFVVPSVFHVVLDMDEGSLSFVVNGQYLGIAFRGLRGLGPLFPIVSAVWGHCEITMRYVNGLPREYCLSDMSVKWKCANQVDSWDPVDFGADKWGKYRSFACVNCEH